jgi:hypothetical protein
MRPEEVRMSSIRGSNAYFSSKILSTSIFYWTMGSFPPTSTSHPKNPVKIYHHQILPYSPPPPCSFDPYQDCYDESGVNKDYSKLFILPFSNLFSVLVLCLAEIKCEDERSS